MIAVDTSALMTVLLREEGWRRCYDLLWDRPTCMSAGTLGELMVVAAGRKLLGAVDILLSGLAIEIVAVDESQARAMGDAYRRWGKGMHAAHLNLGDCFAYTLAMRRDLPLLFIGDDFAKTDVRRAFDG